MRRREVITLLGSAVVWPLAARAQQSERMRRIGVLLPATADDPDFQARVRAFLQGLQQSGSNDGLIVTGSALTSRHRDLIVTLAARHKLPAVYVERYFVAAGGLRA